MLLIRLSPLFKSLVHSFRIEFVPSRHTTQKKNTPINAKEELPLELLFFFKAMDTFETIWLIN